MSQMPILDIFERLARGNSSGKQAPLAQGTRGGKIRERAAPPSPSSHFTHPTLAHFTMPPPPVEVDPQLAEIEEWEATALAATIEAFERQQLEDMEEVEQRTQRHRERAHHELHREEMHKRRHVKELEQQLRQEEATRKAAANARKD